MLPGTYKPENPLEFSFTVTVNGVVRPHQSFKWAGETRAGLPDSMVAVGSGITTCSGSVIWAPETVVQESPFRPVGESRWAPAYGDTVTIDATYKGVTWRVFTGKITETRFSGNTAVSDFRDRIKDYLDRKISINAHGSHGNIAPDSQALRAIEHCGLGALPSPQLAREIPGLTLVAHVAGTDIAEVGEQWNSGYRENSSYGVEGVDVRVTPAAGGPTGPGVLAVSRSVMNHTDSSIAITVAGASFSLTFEKTSGEYVLRKNNSVIHRAVRPAEDTDPLPVLAFAVSVGGIRLWLSRTQSIWVPGSHTLGALGQATSRIAPGISVWVAENREVEEAVVASLYPRPLVARLRPRRVGMYQRGVRGFENTSGWDIITSYCEATLSTIYMDEAGTPILTARERVITAKPATDIKLVERAFADGFTTGANGLYGAVTVHHQDGYVTSQGRGNGTLFYQPENIQEITVGDELQQIITIPDEMDWIGPDLSWEAIIDASDGVDNRAAFNTPVGSYWQICFEDPDRDGEMRWTGAGFEDISATLEQIGQRAFKMVHRVTGGKSEWKYYLASPSLGVDMLRAGNRGIPMPVIRGDLMVTWVDAQATVQVPGSSSPERFEHDGSWWLTASEAKIIASQLAAEAGTPTVVFDKLPLLFDPRLQLLDVVTLTGWASDGETVFDAWEAECVVTGKACQVEGKVPSMELTVTARSLRDVRAGKTYADLADAYQRYADIPSSSTYGGVYEALPGKA